MLSCIIWIDGLNTKLDVSWFFYHISFIALIEIRFYFIILFCMLIGWSFISYSTLHIVHVLSYSAYYRPIQPRIWEKYFVRVADRSFWRWWWEVLNSYTILMNATCWVRGLDFWVTEGSSLHSLIRHVDA